MCTHANPTWHDLAPDAQELIRSLWPEPSARPEFVPGETPPAYEAERYTGIADEASGEGTRRRSAS